MVMFTMQGRNDVCFSVLKDEYQFENNGDAAAEGTHGAKSSGSPSCLRLVLQFNGVDVRAIIMPLAILTYGRSPLHFLCLSSSKDKERERPKRQEKTTAEAHWLAPFGTVAADAQPKSKHAHISVLHLSVELLFFATLDPVFPRLERRLRPEVQLCRSGILNNGVIPSHVEIFRSLVPIPLFSQHRLPTPINPSLHPWSATVLPGASHILFLRLRVVMFNSFQPFVLIVFGFIVFKFLVTAKQHER
mmetsp:Transcript_5821/g.14505  ORF Transcript_5821/g.14505 Transcript_5821/m.14505 type:complete len:246 (+) Transcript_5821:562-1299(+)